MANIALRLSTGSAGTTSTGAAGSIGGALGIDSNALILTSNTSLNNLFDDISKLENSEGTTDYRCVYIVNDTATSGAVFADAKVFLSGLPKADIHIGIGTINSVAEVIANENTAPSGIVFSSPTTTVPLGLDTGVLNPGDSIPVWIRRTAQNVSGSGVVTDIISMVIRGIE